MDSPSRSDDPASGLAGSRIRTDQGSTPQDSVRGRRVPPSGRGELRSPREGATVLRLGRGPTGRDRQRRGTVAPSRGNRSEEHTSELQSRLHLVCRLLLEKKKKKIKK